MSARCFQLYDVQTIRSFCTVRVHTVEADKSTSTVFLTGTVDVIFWI